MLAVVQLNRYSPMTSRNGRLLNVDQDGLAMGIGSGSSSDGRSRAIRKTISGGIIATRPRVTPVTAKRTRWSLIDQPSTVARMIAPRVPAIEKAIR